MNIFEFKIYTYWSCLLTMNNIMKSLRTSVQKTIIKSNTCSPECGIAKNSLYKLATKKYFAFLMEPFFPPPVKYPTGNPPLIHRVTNHVTSFSSLICDILIDNCSASCMVVGNALPLLSGSIRCRKIEVTDNPSINI